MTQIARHRLLSLLLATALIATLTVLFTEGPRAGAIDGPVDVVYVATGRNFPDALAGGTLATTVGAPLLTVEAALPIPPATVAALLALDPDRIVVFGGEVAVSAEVFGALRTHARSGDVTRIAGDNRHDTAARIADALPNPGPLDADTLDGRQATDFLATTAQASDSAKLGGLAAGSYATTADLPTSETVTAYASCSGAGFFPVGSVDYLGHTESSRYLVGTLDNIEMLCPLHLPQGARIIEVIVNVIDTSSTRQIGVVGLVADAIGSAGGPQFVANSVDPITNDPGNTGDGTVTLPALDTLATTVDNARWGYAATVRLDAISDAPSGVVAIRGVSVAYEVDRLTMP